jgi:D-alanyl-D-alanine carboxypeptidase/D-alanyl-D-alanine-endopeptidase (penicillin-binding protein 4)
VRLRPLHVALALVAAGSCGCAAAAVSPGADRPLADRIEQRLAEPPFDRVQWGLLVVDARSGRTLYERSPDLLFIPGSNMKLPVAAAAFGLLGPEYRWQTTVFSHALPTDGVLAGDLYLAAEGDPTLGAPFHGSARDALLALADSLRGAGIREIGGRLVVDVSAWDSTTVPESWMVEDLMGAAGATGGAFSVGEGELEIRVRGAERAGEPPAVDWEPSFGAEAGPAVESRAETVAAAVPAELRVGFLPESRRWTVEGGVPAGEIETFSLSQRDPVRLGTAALAKALEDRGIRVGGGTAVVWERDLPLEAGCVSGRVPSCPGMLRVAGLASPPLSEVAAELLGHSQNWVAEQLIRTIGAEQGEEGSWAEGFRAALGYLASEAGVSPEEIHFEDGSGLSNHDLISPRALVRILDHARGQPWGVVFRSALARPGVERTTLADRLPELEGRVFAKTGSLSHVNSLSGYLVTDGGRELIFSILSNGANLPSSAVRARIDTLVRELAR